MAPEGWQIQNVATRFLRSMAAQSLAMCVVWMALAMLADAYANTTYRVGTQVLVVGDAASRVSALLGKPQSISRGSHTGGRIPGQNTKRRHRGSRDRKGPRKYPATQWHYRLGREYVVVTFVSGRVVDIATGR
jgi:Protein of unknown function (DUF2845)